MTRLEKARGDFEGGLASDRKHFGDTSMTVRIKKDLHVGDKTNSESKRGGVKK